MARLLALATLALLLAVPTPANAVSPRDGIIVVDGARDCIEAVLYAQDQSDATLWRIELDYHSTTYTMHAIAHSPLPVHVEDCGMTPCSGELLTARLSAKLMREDEFEEVRTMTVPCLP